MGSDTFLEYLKLLKADNIALKAEVDRLEKLVRDYEFRDLSCYFETVDWAGEEPLPPTSKKPWRKLAPGE